MVRIEQQQDFLGLAFTTTLFLQKSFQEATGNFAQLGEALLKQYNLLTMVSRWPMGRIRTPLPGLTKKQLVLSQLPDLAIIDEELRFCDPNRKHFTYHPPGHRVLIVAVGNRSFHVDNAIYDLCRVVMMFGKRQ
jgi:hypothetical protein